MTMTPHIVYIGLIGSSGRDSGCSVEALPASCASSVSAVWLRMRFM